MNTPYDYYSAVQDYLGLKGHEGAGLEREAVRVCGELEKVFVEAEAAEAAKAAPSSTIYEQHETKHSPTTAGAKSSNTVS